MDKGEVKRHLEHIERWLKAHPDSCPSSELPRVRQWCSFCDAVNEIYDGHTGDPIGGMAYRLADQLCGFLGEGDE
jgi:hypothetical protein